MVQVLVYFWHSWFRVQYLAYHVALGEGGRGVLERGQKHSARHVPHFHLEKINGCFYLCCAPPQECRLLTWACSAHLDVLVVVKSVLRGTSHTLTCRKWLLSRVVYTVARVSFTGMGA